MKIKGPVVRISRGRFEAECCEKIRKLIDKSARSLVPAIQELRGLLYYHAAVDPTTGTVVNVSIWESVDAAKQMETLQVMLEQRPILEAAGVQFDNVANYEPLWKIEGNWPLEDIAPQ